MVVRLIDIEPPEIALLCSMLESDIHRLNMDMTTFDMTIELEKRGLVVETPDLLSFTLTEVGRELAVKASLTFGNFDS